MRNLFAGTLALFGFVGALFVFAPASSAIEIHAHRGGSNVEGVATYPENSLSGMTHSVSQGWVIEFDLHPTSDGVPVVMHDDTLDRTTDCTGPVDEITLADLADDCRIDQLGSEDPAIQLPVDDPRREQIPTLDQVIDLLETTGGRANIEVKDLAGEHPEFVTAVYNRLEASDIPSGRVILQNFKSTDLASAKSLYPGVATSLLSPFATDGYPLPVAVAQGIDWVSPQWPVSGEFVKDVWAAGKKIVPYTIDDAAELEAAGALRVDAVISNDPTRADRLVGDLPGGPVPVDPDPPPGPGPDPVAPKASLSMRLIGKTKVRAGKPVRFFVRIVNSGTAASKPATVKVGTGRSAIRPQGLQATRIPAIAAGKSYRYKVPLVTKNRVRKAVRARVRFVLVQEGLPAVKKVRVFVVKPGQRRQNS